MSMQGFAKKKKSGFKTRSVSMLSSVEGRLRRLLGMPAEGLDQVQTPKTTTTKCEASTYLHIDILQAGSLVGHLTILGQYSEEYNGSKFFRIVLVDCS